MARGLSKSDAMKQIRALGAFVQWIPDIEEFRVNIPTGNEDTAYYTNDAQDAVGTARMMLQRYYAKKHNPMVRYKGAKNPMATQRIITDARGLARLMKNPTIRRRVRNIAEGATEGTGPTRRFLPFRDSGDYDPSRLGKRSLAHETAAIRAEYDPGYRKRKAAKKKKAVKRVAAKKRAPAKKRAATKKRKPAAKKRNPGKYRVEGSNEHFSTLAKARTRAKYLSSRIGGWGIVTTQSNTGERIIVAEYYAGQKKI
jgi:hypothetical protein